MLKKLILFGVFACATASLLPQNAQASLGINLGTEASWATAFNVGPRSWGFTPSLEIVWRQKVGEIGLFADDFVQASNWLSLPSQRHVPYFGFVLRGYFQKKLQGPWIAMKIDPLTLAFALLGVTPTSSWAFTGIGLHVGWRLGSDHEVGFAIQPHIGLRIFSDPNPYVAGFSRASTYQPLLAFDFGILFTLF